MFFLLLLVKCWHVWRKSFVYSLIIFSISARVNACVFRHVCQSVTFRFRNFSVSKLFHFFYGIGIGFGNFWYRKKYRYRFRKNLVSEKVSVSVSKIFGIEKSIGIGFEFFLVSIKVSESVSEKIGINKSISFEKIWYKIFFLASFYLYWTQSVDLKSFRFGFETFPCFLMVSVSKKIWSRKKYRYRFRKILVSKKVSVSVSKIFGIDKSIGIGFGKNLVSKKVLDSVSKKIGIGKKFRIRFRSDFGFRHTLMYVIYMSVQQTYGLYIKLNAFLYALSSK